MFSMQHIQCGKNANWVLQYRHLLDKMNREGTAFSLGLGKVFFYREVEESKV